TDNSRVVLAGSETGKQPGTYITGTYLFDLATRTTSRILRDGMLGIMVSPDGRSIAATYQGSYFLSPVEGGEPQPIEGMEDGDNLAGWSSDGRFLFVRGANDFRAPLYKVDLRSGKRSLWKTLSPADPSGLIGIGSDPRGVRV